MKDKIIKKIKELSWKKWAMIAGGLGLIVLGFWFAGLWGTNRDNLILAMGFVLCVPGGGYLVYLGFREQIKGAEVMIVGSEKPTGPVNSLNIYAIKIDGIIYASKIAFEWVDNPIGQLQQCLNNGQWYYIHRGILEIISGKITQPEPEPFLLPDSQYFDPAEFANVIKMPAHQRLFERQTPLFQKIAPVFMVIAFGLAIIGFIASAPVPVPGG